jgi:hypothetical protein
MLRVADLRASLRGGLQPARQPGCDCRLVLRELVGCRRNGCLQKTSEFRPRTLSAAAGRTSRRTRARRRLTPPDWTPVVAPGSHAARFLHRAGCSSSRVVTRSSCEWTAHGCGRPDSRARCECGQDSFRRFDETPLLSTLIAGAPFADAEVGYSASQGGAERRARRAKAQTVPHSSETFWSRSIDTHASHPSRNCTDTHPKRVPETTTPTGRDPLALMISIWRARRDSNSRPPSS